jgi:hypothetical protein
MRSRIEPMKNAQLLTFRCLELALYRSLGRRPEPESTHDLF